MANKTEKMSAVERMKALFDEGSFSELFAGKNSSVVVGTGSVLGKTVSAYGTTYSDNYWGTKSPCLIFSDSDDLINWKNTRCIRMVTLSAEAMSARGQSQMHVWAPEVILDDGSSKEVTGEKYTYGVIWSGDGNLSRDAAYKIPASNTSGYDWANRTYINYTNDFVTFTDCIFISFAFVLFIVFYASSGTHSYKYASSDIQTPVQVFHQPGTNAFAGRVADSGDHLGDGRLSVRR